MSGALYLQQAMRGNNLIEIVGQGSSDAEFNDSFNPSSII
jgi:hypothetical protein